MSNFDVVDSEQLLRLEGGTAAQTDQGPLQPQLPRHEWSLLPLCLQEGLPIIAYSPLEEGRPVESAASLADRRPLATLRREAQPDRDQHEAGNAVQRRPDSRPLESLGRSRRD